MKRNSLFAVVAMGGILTNIPAVLADASAPQPDKPAAAAFNDLAEQYFDQAYFKYAPTSGTLAGFHRYDTQLEDFSRSAVDAQIATLHGFETKFSVVNASQLDLTAQGDLALIRSNIHGTLLTLETIRPWEKTLTSTRPALPAASSR